VTLSSPVLVADSRAAAAEFDLGPLLEDLQQNRPLRLRLPRVFSDLAVPPYVVEEWRTLAAEPGGPGSAMAAGMGEPTKGR
jgi:hypothetical protein